MKNMGCKHLAIIMDGNGRWAQAKKRNRFWGHLKGASVAQTVVDHCVRHTTLEHLTLYAFSTENWKRPKEEVSFLFRLLDRHLERKQKQLVEGGVRLNVLGNLDPLPHNLKTRIQSLVEATKNNARLNLNLALNYGGRDELVYAVNKLIQKGEPVNKQALSQALYSKDFPDPDLIIRTSGEMRLSNFMLWQAAYSELYFTPTLWPDFTPTQLDEAFQEFAKRTRNFGGLTSSPQASTEFQL